MTVLYAQSEDKAAGETAGECVDKADGDGAYKIISYCFLKNDARGKFLLTEAELGGTTLPVLGLTVHPEGSPGYVVAVTEELSAESVDQGKVDVVGGDAA